MIQQLAGAGLLLTSFMSSNELSLGMERARAESGAGDQGQLDQVAADMGQVRRGRGEHALHGSLWPRSHCVWCWGLVWLHCTALLTICAQYHSAAAGSLCGHSGSSAVCSLQRAACGQCGVCRARGSPCDWAGQCKAQAAVVTGPTAAAAAGPGQPSHVGRTRRGAAAGPRNTRTASRLPALAG